MWKGVRFKGKINAEYGRMFNCKIMRRRVIVGSRNGGLP
jgi:hypothetical protein